MWTSVQKDKCHPMDMGFPLARIISHYWYVDIFPSGIFCPFWAKKGKNFFAYRPLISGRAMAEDLRSSNPSRDNCNRVRCDAESTKRGCSRVGSTTRSPTFRRL